MIVSMQYGQDTFDLALQDFQDSLWVRQTLLRRDWNRQWADSRRHRHPPCQSKPTTPDTAHSGTNFDAGQIKNWLKFFYTVSGGAKGGVGKGLKPFPYLSWEYRKRTRKSRFHDLLIQIILSGSPLWNMYASGTLMKSPGKTKVSGYRRAPTWHGDSKKSLSGAICFAWGVMSTSSYSTLPLMF